MKKFTYHIKGVYPGEFQTNVTVLDFNKGIGEFKPVHFYERPYNGRIWVDNVELGPIPVMQARKALSGTGGIFTWHDRHTFGILVTSLAICLHIFQDEQIAVNMYVPFMREVLCGLEAKSFEIELDLEQFVNDHADRMTHHFYTHYFDLGPFNKFEFNFKQDRITGAWSADILDQLCWELVYKEKGYYEERSVKEAFFRRNEPPKPPFDWEKKALETRKELCRLFFTPSTSVVKSTTLSGVIANAGICLGLYRKLDTWKVRGKFQTEKWARGDLDKLILEHGASEERKYELMFIADKVGASLHDLVHAVTWKGTDLDKVEKSLLDQLDAHKKRIFFDDLFPRKEVFTPVNLKLLYAFHKLWEEEEHNIREKNYEILLYNDIPEIHVSHNFPGLKDRWGICLVYETSKMEFFIRDFGFTNTKDIHSITGEQMYGLFLRGKVALSCAVGRHASSLLFLWKNDQMHVVCEETGESFRLDAPLKESDEFFAYTRAFFKETLDKELELEK